jgi:D-lactate dehydrogenase (cytochrome)
MKAQGVGPRTFGRAISTLSAIPKLKKRADYSVPVSKLPQLVYETKQDLADSGLRSTIVGHVGDGNFHALILFKDDKELEEVSAAVHRMVHRAIALDGTCASFAGICPLRALTTDPL